MDRAKIRCSAVWPAGATHLAAGPRQPTFSRAALSGQERPKGPAHPDFWRMGEEQPHQVQQPRGLARFGIRRVPAVDRGAAEGPQPGDRQSGDLQAPPPRPRGLARFGIRAVPGVPAGLREGDAPQREFHARLASLDTLRFQPSAMASTLSRGDRPTEGECPQPRLRPEAQEGAVPGSSTDRGGAGGGSRGRRRDLSGGRKFSLEPD